MNKKINTPNPLRNILKKYILHLQFERRLSVNTTNSYYYDLEKYVDYLFYTHNIINTGKIYKNHLNKYISTTLKYFSQSKEYKGSSLSRNLSSIKSFHDYLLRNSLSKSNPLDDIDFPKLYSIKLFFRK